jgi:hypothetical protein
MLHEVPDQMAMLRQVRDLLVPGGRMFLAEPPGHMKPGEIENEIARCRAAGFEELPLGQAARSHHALFERTRGRRIPASR